MERHFDIGFNLLTSNFLKMLITNLLIIAQLGLNILLRMVAKPE